MNLRDTIKNAITAFLGLNQINQRLEKIENRLKGIENRLKGNARAINGSLRLIGMVIDHLNLGKAKLIKIYTELAEVPEKASPLLENERKRLNSYLAKARRGELFTAEEVSDYTKLVKKLEQEKKDDSSVWSLIALGSFLAGLFFRKKQD